MMAIKNISTCKREDRLVASEEVNGCLKRGHSHMTEACDCCNSINIE